VDKGVEMRFRISAKPSDSLSGHAGARLCSWQQTGIARRPVAWTIQRFRKRRNVAILAALSALASFGLSPASAQSPGWFQNTSDVYLDNDDDGTCADLPGWFAPTSGMALQNYYCQPKWADNQTFDFIWEGAIYGIDLYTIRPHLNHSLCVDPQGVGTPYPGNSVKVFPCVADPFAQDNQVWFLHATGPLDGIFDAGPYRIRQAKGSEHLCLKPRYSYYFEVNKPLILARCGTPGDTWSIH
jgi:hypothetical protein